MQDDTDGAFNRFLNHDNDPEEESSSYQVLTFVIPEQVYSALAVIGVCAIVIQAWKFLKGGR